ncbi:uncharacterized protein LOC143919252 [Arctopsyche grandis]|uniref:uncharacterized protein LOC143919252 n=1 Tax=Arctopsyche grandis TaxID=121162 RepID=UPI00406D8E68
MEILALKEYVYKILILSVHYRFECQFIQFIFFFKNNVVEYTKFKMSEIKFTINGTEYIVDHTVGNKSLNRYIRNNAKLTGTKAMCFEGGCGACIVSVSALHPVTKEPETFSVNSCLVSVLSCHGWAITTVEGIGNRKDGYHPIQTRLAGFNGTQCGYCSPGWVMSMYSLNKSQPNGLTMKETENSFAGNICRCTGYRPILDAFKSFSNDADSSLTQRVMDIEELSKTKMCAKSGLICTKSCNDYTKEGTCTANMERPIEEMVLDTKMIEIDGKDVRWYKAFSLKDIFDIFIKEGTDSYRFVAGNTAKGIFKIENEPKVCIDINSVVELRDFEMSADVLQLGGGMTLNEIMKVFKDVGNSDIKFQYLLQMYHHMDLIAHVPVRNIGTIGGNLSIKHEHNEFQSDIFVMLEAVGATISIVSSGNIYTMSPLEYLSMDMKGKVIHRVNLVSLTSDHVFQSYKIMPRGQNAHAHINAGFLFKFNTNKTIVEKATIVYGGVNPNFNHATKTEEFLVGKNIFDKQTFKSAIQNLSTEIVPNVTPPEPTPDYRKKLAIGLFYKCILHISPSGMIDSRYKSGGDEFNRPVSSGKQEFDTNKDIWPLNEPVLKIEGLVQCSGEAEYINDIPRQPGELRAAFVLSTIYGGTLDKIDATEALAMDGVHAMITAKDIPGKNSFTSQLLIFNEEILCSEKILYHGQPIALVLADSTGLAMKAAEKVKVTYTNIKTTPPILTIRQALKDKNVNKRLLKNKIILNEAKTKGKNVKKVIKGSFDIFGQYHYTMETQICLCVPIEDGMDVFSATQWMDLINIAVAEALDVSVNSINIKVRRLGGGYGSKINRCSMIATACAVAAKVLNRPVRFVMPLKTNMMAVGKRNPCSNDYEVGVDDDGKIQYLTNVFYEDNGCSNNDNVVEGLAEPFFNCYDYSSWSVEGYGVLTDTASNTPCRAPGTTEGVAAIENIMEHIAVETGKDPVAVRLVNMSEGNKIKTLIEDWKASSDYNLRYSQVQQFNMSNRWRKRGISLIPLQYGLHYFGNYASLVSVYHGDGTVSVSHGGIEMGQGLNTKVAQVCAHILGIPLETVAVKPSNSLVAPNAMVSGGSSASEVCCFATMKACEMMLERLKPIKETMVNPTWPELIKKAHMMQVDLCTHYMFTPKDATWYFILGVTVAEVEVDMLTGNHQVLRVDLLEDTGESLSPLVDVGQVEGAYMMGLGYYTSEHLVYDEKTGELLTNRTWNYKPPGVKDIPIDFRIKFLQNSPNPAGVLRSKATGEPPLNMAIGIVTAIRQAITSARMEIGLPTNEWYNIDIPLTTENIIQATNSSINDFEI